MLPVAFMVLSVSCVTAAESWRSPVAELGALYPDDPGGHRIPFCILSSQNLSGTIDRQPFAAVTHETESTISEQEHKDLRLLPISLYLKKEHHVSHFNQGLLLKINKSITAQVLHSP